MVRVGGATVAEAAARLGVTASTAYNWMRTATTPSAGQPDRNVRAKSTRIVPIPGFVRVVASREVGAGIVVRVGGAEIHVRRDFEADVLCAVVEALRGVAA